MTCGWALSIFLVIDADPCFLGELGFGFSLPLRCRLTYALDELLRTALEILMAKAG